MVPWAEAPEPILADIHTVITDVDDTLTRQGRLEGATLNALDRLRRSGIRVIPATAASAGWASLMAA
ncbi:MAG TPA: HAD family hydrolase, partial [Magnetospirillum sp.]|nr:HAD family hydrolase [Magnetospirillum sp.]